MSDAPLGNLILRTRVQILKGNLEKIRTTRTSIERVRQEVRSLVTLPKERDVETSIRTIRTAIVTSENEVKSKTPNGQVIWNSLTSIKEEVDALEGYLAGAEQLVHSIETRFLSVTQGKLGTELENELEAEAETQVGALEALIASIDAAARTSDDVARQAHQQAWRDYADQAVYGAAERLFHEYVDLLGGLALRDSGFDQGICRIADELIRTCASKLPEFGWYSLTIPARQEALEVTMARIIRLGFPEWTIWTLPLAAHELGHVVALGRIAPLLETEREAGFDEHHTQICFADALATFVMGPAYACAAILMRLDPFQAIAPEDERLTLKRAACVLHELDGMNSAAGMTNPYGGIVERLRSEWEDALIQAAATLVEEDPEQNLGDRQLTVDEIAHVGRVADFITTMFGRGRGFPASGWGICTEWANSLADDGGASIQPSALEIDLRYVPNAVWRLRLDMDGFANLDQAAEAAVNLWHRLEKLLSEESDQGWGPIDMGTRGTKTPRGPKPGAAEAAGV